MAVIDNTENVSKKKAVKSSTQDRITNLPLAKIKHIIKLDPDVKLVNGKSFITGSLKCQFLVNVNFR